MNGFNWKTFETFIKRKVYVFRHTDEEVKETTIRPWTQRKSEKQNIFLPQFDANHKFLKKFNDFWDSVDEKFDANFSCSSNSPINREKYKFLLVSHCIWRDHFASSWLRT